MTMVDYRSGLSHSRTGIHGGLRRGTAAAAAGVVLVLSAGIPASQAADGSPDPGSPDVQVTGTVQLPVVGSLVQGLLGSATQSPTPASTSPAPTASVAPAPATAAPAPATASQPQAAGTPPAGTAPAGSAPAVSGTRTATPGAASGMAPAAKGAVPAPQQADQPASAPAESPAPDQPTSALTPTAGSTSRIGNLHAAGTPAGSRQSMAPAPAPAVEATKVWLGVGLLGSAGVAGLVFARIRRS
jgi:hypothetical protein